YGGKWYRKIDQNRYHVIDLINWKEMCGSNAPPETYNVDLSEIDISGPMLSDALRSLDQPSDGLDEYGDPLSNFDLIKVVCLHAYGAKAPLGSWDGNNFHKLMAEAKKLSNELVKNHDLYERHMNRPVNKIGTSARDYARGEILNLDEMKYILDR